jgi:hypothetical protein
MNSRGIQLLSLPVVTALLAALALGLVFLGRYLGLGVYSLALIAIPLALAVAYLAWYRTLPYEPTTGPAASPLGPGTEEPFEDPVEEADRLSRTPGETPAADEPGEDSPEKPDAPVPPA